MLINMEEMRMLKTDTPEVRFNLLQKNIERFFRDYIYYYNLYEGKELIIDAGYLPFHYLDERVLDRLVLLLEKELGYGIIITKITNTMQAGYQRGDLINIRLFDTQEATQKDVDDYFNLRMYQPLYSSFHDYTNFDGTNELQGYVSCLDTQNPHILGGQTKENL